MMPMSEPNISFRHYLFAENGMQRLSRRVIDGLAHGKDAMPQYAGTRQKYAEVLVELEDGKPNKVLSSKGRYLTFDEAGRIDKGLMMDLAGRMDLLPSKPHGEGTIVNIAPELKRAKFKRENEWTLGAAELDRIALDIWPKSKGDVLKTAKGAAAKRPPLTSEAKWALDRITERLSSISIELQQLSEPALKGLAFEARRLSEGDHLMLGLADAAAHRQEILSRHRTGKGAWFAIIEGTWLPPGKNVGEIQCLASEKHEGKEAAVAAARRLLAQFADRFRSDYSIEVSVLCDLEWFEDERSRRE